MNFSFEGINLWFTEGDWGIVRWNSKGQVIVSGPDSVHKSQSRNYFSFAYSAFASMRIGMSGSASFHSVRKS
jgi:hypothetical protein